MPSARQTRFESLGILTPKIRLSLDSEITRSIEHEAAAASSCQKPRSCKAICHIGEWVFGSSVVATSYAQLANIVNGLAQWLVKDLGPSQRGLGKDVLAYVYLRDSALIRATIKAGYVVRALSSRLIYW